MAISNLQETLLMYTKYKSRMNLRISDIQLNMLAATKQETIIQDKYNKQMRDYYYEYNQYNFGEGDNRQDEYNALCEALENEMESRLNNLRSWEDQLNTDKLDYEVRLSEITANENQIKQQLKTNLNSDFTYGGAGGGKS